MLYSTVDISIENLMSAVIKNNISISHLNNCTARLGEGVCGQKMECSTVDPNPIGTEPSSDMRKVKICE